MEKQIKLCTLLTKPFVLFVLLFALGVGEMWGGNSATNAHIYFDNTNSQWTTTGDYKINVLIGRQDDWGGGNGQGGQAFAMTPVPHTTNLYYKHFDEWKNYDSFLFNNTSSEWSSDWNGENPRDRAKSGVNYSGDYETDMNQTHIFTPSSSTKGAGLSYATGATYTVLNSAQTVAQYLTTNGGSSYSAYTTANLATITISTYKMNGDNSTTESSASMSAGEASCDAALTATVTMEVTNVAEGYQFVGWYDGDTEKGTETTYTYAASGAKTIRARFATKFYVSTLYLRAGTNWRSGSPGPRFAACFKNLAGTESWVNTSGTEEFSSVAVPDGDWNYVIMCRMNGSEAGNEWANRWDQTSNMYPDGVNNCVYVADNAWGGSTGNVGSWTSYAPVPAISGTMNNWRPTANQFSGSPLRLTMELPAGTAYNFKVANGLFSSWYGHGASNNNDLTFAGQTNAETLTQGHRNMMFLTARAGTYTFEWDAANSKLTIIYPDTLHPSMDYVYMEKYSGWNSGDFSNIHYWDDSSNPLTAGSDDPKMTAYHNFKDKRLNYYIYPMLTDYPNFKAADGLNGGTGSNHTDDMVATGHGGHYTYYSEDAKKWVWSTFQVYIKLENQGADEGKKGTLGVPVAFNDTALSARISKPVKTNYDFGGYYTAAEGGGVQIIDADGDWIANKLDYTSASGAWIHAGDTTTLYAKWTETARSITLQVSPSGAGSFDVGGVAKAHGDVINAYISTPTETITAIASHGAWKFKEWRYSEGVGNKAETGMDNTVQINSDRDGTLTAVFEPRYVLYGSIYNNDDDKSGMPGWPNHSLETAEFEVNTTSPCNLTCERTLLAGKTYKFVVHDRAAQKNYGYDPAGSNLPEGTSWLFDDVNFDVYVTTKSYGTYTFKINNITESEGNYYPTVTIDRPANPHALELGWRYTQIDDPSTLKEGDTGGTVSAQTTETDESHHDIANGGWIAHGSGITFTASHATGYSFNGEWYDNNNCATKFMDGNPSTKASNITDNFRVYVKFDEISTSVTLSATNGQIKVGDTPSSETTCGVTTTRSLTAVPNDGYYFTGWSLSDSPDFQLDDKASDTDPEVILRGKGNGTAGTLTANFALRYSLKGTMNSENWGTDHYISNIATVGGKAIGYVDITLAANTSYEFAIYDLGPGGGWLKDNDTQVYYMTNGNSYVWGFGLGRTQNCGITTAGAGTYRFMWNITDKTMSVIYPNFVIYRTGDKAEDSESATHTTTSTVESYDGGTINQGIEFRMKVRELDKWYTLCLPFTVNKVCVWDAEDGKYYEMKPYYRSAPGETFYTGHYVIRSPYGEGVAAAPGVEIELAKFDDWRDPVNASVLPSASTPYIIQWHHSYFYNRYISFFGTIGQTIPTSMTSVAAPSANDKVRVCGNDAMKEGKVAGAYMLDNDYGSGAWLRDEDKTKSRTISPFECYILASGETTGKYLVIRRGMTTDDTPTGWDDVLNSERKVRINVYTISGFMVTQFNDCSFAEAAQRLRTECGEGIFILRSENESVKLMVGGK